MKNLNRTKEQTKKEIIEAYMLLRENNQSIPSDTLEFMKDAAIEKLEGYKEKEERRFRLLKGYDR